MQVVLIKDVQGLGKAGDLKNVSDGYAKNYLLARKLAAKADSKNLELLKGNKIQKEQKNKKEALEALKLAKKLKGIILRINGKTNESGTLYAAIGEEAVAEALKKEGFIVDKKMIELHEHIKNVGKFMANINLHGGLKAQINIEVTSK